MGKTTPIPPEVRAEILHLLEAREPVADIAARCHVSPSTVRAALDNRPDLKTARKGNLPRWRTDPDLAARMRKLLGEGKRCNGVAVILGVGPRVVETFLRDNPDAAVPPLPACEVWRRDPDLARTLRDGARRGMTRASLGAMAGVTRDVVVSFLSAHPDLGGPAGQVHTKTSDLTPEQRRDYATLTGPGGYPGDEALRIIHRPRRRIRAVPPPGARP